MGEEAHKDRRVEVERRVDQGRNTAGSLALAAAINKHVAEANRAWQVINTLTVSPRTPMAKKGATGHRDSPLSGTRD